MPGIANKLTFTRNSTANYTDESGVTQTAAADEPRFDYSGGAIIGLLVESASGSRAVERLSGSLGESFDPDSFSFEISARAGSYSQTQVFLQVDDGTESNAIRVYREDDGNLILAVVSSGSLLFDLVFGSVSDDEDFTFRLRYQSGDYAIALSGGTLYEKTGSVPSGLTTMRIGGSTPYSESNATFDDGSNWTLSDSSQLVFVEDSDLACDGWIKTAETGTGSLFTDDGMTA